MLVATCSANICVNLIVEPYRIPYQHLHDMRIIARIMKIIARIMKIIARILLVAVFVALGLSRITDPKPTAKHMMSSPFPKYVTKYTHHKITEQESEHLIQGIGAVMVAGSAFIVMGIYRRFWAFILALTLLTAFMQDNLQQPEKTDQQGQIHVAHRRRVLLMSLIGGLLYVAFFGSARVPVNPASNPSTTASLNPASNPSTTASLNPASSPSTTASLNPASSPSTTASRLVTVDCHRCASRTDVLVLVPAPSTQVQNMTAPAVRRTAGHWKLAAIPVVMTVVALVFGWWAFHIKDAQNQSLAHQHPSVIYVLVSIVFASILVPFYPHLLDDMVDIVRSIAKFSR
jgi:uncharacterized membrane protein YphA (DoxX/SURF4 family)